MKRFSLLLIGAAALLMNACEQHPLPGQAPLEEESHGKAHGEAAEHSEGKPAAKGEHAEEAAKPAAGHSAEAEKPASSFFPETKK
jgi:hypothetical protein